MEPLKTIPEMTIKKPLFTVFTPTYNRANLLHRVYESLLKQTCQDFEWLIVDDGSNDNTAELIFNWKKESPFDIRYLYQENKGKHVASNVGINTALGELFLFFDSDDACIPEALERFKFHWNNIPLHEKNNFSTISALCVDIKGQLIGREYPEDIIDADTVWKQLMLRSSGDRWGINRTEVLKSYLFPEITNERFISEGIVWNRMAHFYKARFINERLKAVEYTSDGLSASSINIRTNNPIGTRLYYSELSEIKLPFLQKIKALLNYVRFSIHGKISLQSIVIESKYPFVTFLLLIPGYIFYKDDKRKL